MNQSNHVGHKIKLFTYFLKDLKVNYHLLLKMKKIKKFYLI